MNSRKSVSINEINPGLKILQKFNDQKSDIKESTKKSLTIRESNPKK